MPHSQEELHELVNAVVDARATKEAALLGEELAKVNYPEAFEAVDATKAAKSAIKIAEDTLRKALNENLAHGEQIPDTFTSKIQTTYRYKAENAIAWCIAHNMPGLLNINKARFEEVLTKTPFVFGGTHYDGDDDDGYIQIDMGYVAIVRSDLVTIPRNLDRIKIEPVATCQTCGKTISGSALYDKKERVYFCSVKCEAEAHGVPEDEAAELLTD